MTIKSRLHHLAIGLTAILAHAIAGAQPPQYQFVEIPMPDGGSAQLQANDINNDGTVVGITRTGPQRSLIWDPVNGSRDLALNHRAEGINDFGQVGGFFGGPGNWQAFIWDNGVYTNLGRSTGAFESTPIAINNHATVVGYDWFTNFDPRASIGTAATGMRLLHPALETVDSYAYDINDAEQVVGGFQDGSATRAFLWENGNLSILAELPGSVFATARGINQSGEITGVSGNVPVRWVNGVVEPIGTIAGGTGSGYDVNDGGVIVGTSGNRAFVWKDGQIYDLNTVTINLPAGFVLNNARAINTSGVITGTGNRNGFRGFALFPIATNNDPVCDAGPDQSTEATGVLTELQLDGTASSDPDGDPLTFTWSVTPGSSASIADPSAPVTAGHFPTGNTVVTLTVDDGNGGVSSCDVTITVTDITAPDVSCEVNRRILWPPNHRMREVEIRVSASDIATAGPDELTVNATASSSEPDDAFRGDGNTTGDVDGEDGFTAPVPVQLTYDEVQEVFTGTVDLRAERNARRNGRTYTIDIEAADLSGNAGLSSCEVIVPLSLRKKGRHGRRHGQRGHCGRHR